MASEPPAAAVGAILAGGRGRRLGGAKATVELAGRPLVEHALAAVRAAGLEPLLVAKAGTRLPALGCETLREPDLPSHPARGIAAALRASGGPVVAVACDMPFLSPALLARLASAPEPLLLVERDGSPQPFPGRYDPALAERLEAAAERGEPLRSALAELRPQLLGGAELARFGPPDRLTFNVNTAVDLALAERLLRED